ncbi:MAG: hypothetical protein HFI09_02035 [Bacilli bacterium]|nr:hypothetical protein [Bacilli bacterium]
MNKKKWIMIGAVIGILLIGFLGWYFIFKSSFGDAQKFKEEYESLNGTIRESDGAVYNVIDIPKDNPIRYVDCAEALEVLKNETAILYVGANWCPWCRNAVPVLIDAATKKNVDPVYYLNLDAEKDTFEIQDGNLVKTVNGSDGYYALLDFLKEELRDYILTDEKGVKYDTHEKRIYMPFVVTSRNGKIVDTHVGTVSLSDGQTKYSLLTDDQKGELYSIYEKMIEKAFHPTTCTTDACE